MVAAVHVEGLVVRYDAVTAVDRVSFSAQSGAVTAVLGPNGAGKTSTIEVCEGFRAPTDGAVRVLGMTPHREQAALSARMGVMLQDGGVSPSSRVGDLVALYAALYGDITKADDLLATVGLGDRARSTVRRLSGGEKQRLSLALALAGRPEVAFLDEPTAGVDVTGRQLIRTVVRDLAAQGCAVVLATHELDEAEKLADHVVILDHGRVVADAPLDELRRGRDEIRFTSSDDVDIDALRAHLGRGVRAVGPGDYVVDGDANAVAALTAWLAERGHPLADLRAGAQRLEDVFVRLTGGES